MDSVTILKGIGLPVTKSRISVLNTFLSYPTESLSIEYLSVVSRVKLRTAYNVVSALLDKGLLSKTLVKSTYLATYQLNIKD